MKLKLILTAFLGFAVPFAATAQKVTYEYEPGTDFSKFKSYKWQRAEGTRYPAHVFDEILMSSIEEQLTAKGLVKSAGEAADVYVVYQLAVVDDMTTNSFKTGGGWLGVPGGNPVFAGGSTNISHAVKKGWILVDVFDANQKKLVWRASATKALKGEAAEKVRRNARKVMDKMFSNYPPGS